VKEDQESDNDEAMPSFEIYKDDAVEHLGATVDGITQELEKKEDRRSLPNQIFSTVVMVIAAAVVTTAGQTFMKYLGGRLTGQDHFEGDQPYTYLMRR
jgi:hypothetical protein